MKKRTGWKSWSDSKPSSNASETKKGLPDLEDYERCGVVGERESKLTGHLAATSRKLERPLAVVVQSSSAAGKSSLMDAVLNFMPVEERVSYSAMTGQSRTRPTSPTRSWPSAAARDRSPSLASKTFGWITLSTVVLGFHRSLSTFDMRLHGGFAIVACLVAASSIGHLIARLRVRWGG